MAQILYGGKGDCSIVGTDIIGVEIHYTGKLIINKTASDEFVLAEGNNKIIIYPIGAGSLTDLFSYVGTLNITNAIAVDSSLRPVTLTVKKVADYAEYISTNAEDLTINSEDLRDSARYIRDVKQTKLLQPTINNQNPTRMNAKLYLEDGSQYFKDVHIHINDSAVMTGATHTKDSQDLYYKQVKNGELIDKLVPTRNPSHIPPALKLNPKRSRKTKTDKITRTAPGGNSGVGSGGGY